jgi:hypothetical protein
MSTSVVTGVTGVIGVCRLRSCRQDVTSWGSGTVSCAGGFVVCRSTLSGLNGNRLVAAHPAKMFLLVMAFCLAGSYKEVKCSLLTVSSSIQSFDFVAISRNPEVRTSVILNYLLEVLRILIVATPPRLPNATIGSRHGGAPAYQAVGCISRDLGSNSIGCL